ncbi:MAG: hypothetical protein GY781_22390 [Gammaproteobacteria bacterium]|nr:hypothetical protein [Gammaproteobacteria bacterium]
MTTQTLKLEEIEKRELKEILQTVLTKNQVLTVQLPNGDEVIIQPRPPLKPLPVLDGHIPEGWKEAIYK